MAGPLQQDDRARLSEDAFMAQRDVLFAYIYAHVRNWSDAEDLFQETAKVAFAKLRESTDVTNMSGWCREIARRLILAHWRNRKKAGPELSDEILAAVDLAFYRQEAADNTAGQRMALLLECAAQLPQHQKIIVDMFYNAGQTLRAIGERLGRSSGAVQVNLCRIRKLLLDCVKNKEQEIVLGHDA